jgi:4a-hydroxytetrahydrobiopterin dehydratase
MNVCNLTDKKCVPCEGGIPPLTAEEIAKLMPNIKNWQLNVEKTAITKHYSFKNFYHTMSFVNAIAWIANQEDHHPDLKVGYNTCEVMYMTHAISGLSENDFICAAKVDALQAE